MNKPKMILMVGLVASGKSTYAKELSKLYNANIHSSDALREELLHNINDQSANTDVFEELHRRIKVDLINGKNVIMDATNISYKRRMTFLQSISKINCEKICVMMATPYEQCLEQNILRDRVVPEHVIKRMYLNFNIPQYYEGFDDIQIAWNYSEDKFDINELFNGENGLNKIEQHSPHHQYTIGQHCLKCYQYVEEYISKIIQSAEDDWEITMAALYHDIGKKFCKAFVNSKGEPCEYAHFYQHHLVSAYDTMFYLKSNGHDDTMILNTVNLIQHHMQPFNINGSEKAKIKFIKLVGQEFYDRLMILHMADKAAH